MNSAAFDAVARRAAETVSRRSSLLTLGGAALAATAAGSDVSLAKKKGKNCNKKCKKKVKKSENKRCSNDVAACNAFFDTQPNCIGNPTCALLKTCCDGCSADGYAECLFGLLTTGASVDSLR